MIISMYCIAGIFFGGGGGIGAEVQCYYWYFCDLQSFTKINSHKYKYFADFHSTVKLAYNEVQGSTEITSLYQKFIINRPICIKILS